MAEDEVDDDMTRELTTLVAAYALDAVSDDERLLLESELAAHEDLAREIDDLRAVAALLAEPVSAIPPAWVRASVLAQLSQVDQLPLQVVTGSALPAGVGDLAGRRARHAARARRTTGWRQSGAVALVAAAVAVGAVFAVQGGTFRSRTSTADTSLSQLVAQPDFVVTHEAVGSGTSTVAYSKVERRAVVSLTSVAAAPAGHTYQLWLIDPSGTATSEGVFATADGSAQLAVDGFRAGQRVGVTVEPAGGSTQPTTTPILDQRLA